jgi:hypothetical protein
LAGVYILENTPPPSGGGGISAHVIWGKKYENAKNKKGENVKEKGRKGEEKGRKGKENDKRGGKRVKSLQNMEELRQKGQNGSRKTTCRERGKNVIFRRGGGINIAFGPKYRPLGVGVNGSEKQPENWVMPHSHHSPV